MVVRAIRLLMTKFRLIEIGSISKLLKKSKILVELNPKRDYTKFFIIGQTILDKETKPIGKVLDIIGNVKKPYALVLAEENSHLTSGTVYVKERRSRR